jgi:PAS domain S-box-containing protein
MDSILIGMPWFIVSILALSLGVLFTISFQKTKNQSKLTFAIAYLFSSVAFLTQINPELQSIVLLESLHKWGALPIITAISLLSISLLKKMSSKVFNSFFYFSIVLTIFMTITSISISPSSIFQIISIVTISLLAVQVFRKRDMLSLMFFISIVMFSFAGAGMALDLDKLFVTTCYIMAFVFTFIALNPKITRNNNGSNDIFSLQEILEKTQEELSLTKNEVKSYSEKFEAILKLIADPVVIVDKKGTFLEMNDAIEEITGYSREELLGTNFLRAKMITTKSKTLLVKNLALRMTGKKVRPYEIEIKNKSGEKIQAELNAKKIEFEGKEADLVVFRDITQRKEIETQLAKCKIILEKKVEERTKTLNENQEKLRSIFESSPNSIIVADIKGKVIDCIQATVEMFGYSSRDEIIGISFFELVAEKDKQRAQEELSNLLKNGSVKNIEYLCLKRDRSEFPTESSISWVRDPLGVRIGFVAITSDITKRKELEMQLEEYADGLEYVIKKRTKKLKETQARLIKSEKFAAIGELATMVAHDLRNPLQGISAATYYLKKNLQTNSNDKLNRMLDLLEKDVEYSEKIVSDLLDYSKEIRLNRQMVSLKKTIEEALKLSKLRPDIHVINLMENSPIMSIDVEKMTRVFVNLIMNSVEAMPDGGKLIIEQNYGDENLEISIADTGIGMDKTVLKNIWTPLFTTKAKGMGLGLSICKRIVEAHGGEITVVSKPEKGTHFSLLLPLIQRIEEVKMCE